MEKRERVIQFLKANYKGEFIVSETPNEIGKYEVSSSGTVILINKDAESLVSDEFIFTKVNKFVCHSCSSLKSLKGAPEKVNNFYYQGCSSLQTKTNVFEKIKKIKLKF